MGTNVIDLIDPLSPEKAKLCLKNADMREMEEREDCFVLDFDPNDLSTLSISTDLPNHDDTDLSVLAEKGQVACRDYPHSRHLCSKNPFEKTPHESHCPLCYCFVCDKAAPCKNWSGTSGHCHAMDNEEWSSMRRRMKQHNL